MTLDQDKAIIVLKLLVEGASVRSTERVTGVHRDTILKLLVLVGEKCEKLIGRLIVNVPCRDVECDEIWAYVGKKEGHKAPAEAHNNTIGDQYCVVGIERNTKLILNFALGRRDTVTTQVFIEGLRAATSSKQKFQITTDGFKPYVAAICDTLEDRITGFAQLIKVYGKPADGEARHSPPEVLDTEVVPAFGNPDFSRVCTSIRGAPEPHHQNAHAQIDPADERVLEEVGEFVGCVLPPLRLLQLLPDSPLAARDARDGPRGTPVIRPTRDT